MTFDEAVELLQKAVKFSAVPGQKHIDLSLVNVTELPRYQKALGIVQQAVKNGDLTEAELHQKLQLIV